MKCYKCGADMIDGAVFCGNCGARMEDAPKAGEAAGEPSKGAGAPEPEAPVAAVPEASAKEPESAFCPNCGKKLTAADVFCDECGYQMSGGGEGAAPGKKGNKTLLPVAVAVAVVAVAGIGALAFSQMGKGGSSGGAKSKVIYAKDDSLMMIDVSKKKSEPIELTDSYVDGDENQITGVDSNERFISEDGKYICYLEDWDGESYDLYRAKMSKPSEGTKIESKVNDHRLLKDNTILYKKKSTLYHYTEKESVKFDKDVITYFLDEDQKYVCWSRSDKGEVTYYLQDIAQKTNKVKLEDDVDDFYYKEDFSQFYVRKDDNLYAVSPEGERDKIAKDVERVISFDKKTGMFYYVKDNSEDVPYADFTYDDTGNISEYDRDRLKERTYTFELKSLYLYDGNEEILISDRASRYYNVSLSDKGRYLLYRECPALENVEVAWSALDSGSWGSVAEEAIEEASVIMLAAEGEPQELSEEIQISDARFNAESGRLYIYSVDEDGEDGVVYVTSTKGEEVGVLEEYDSDAEDASLLMATEEGLYYLKDYEDGGGDLYFNGEEILSDVASVRKLGESSKMAIRSDRDYDDNSYTLSAWDGKKSTQIAEDVNMAECAEDGTAVFIIDYNYNRQEGDLVYFNGKEVRTLDQDVSGFLMRSGSSEV